MKVGLFFGSFNPVHVGHMILAQYILEHTDIKTVWFIISPQNPFKEDKELLNKDFRLDMVNMAIVNEEKMRVNDIEFDMPVPSYTCDTLAKLKQQYPSYDFHIITGVDSWNTVDKWKNSDYITKNFKAIVYPRFQQGSFYLIHPATLKQTDIYLKDAPITDLSSTFIRKAIKDNKNVSYFLPTIVWDYIKHKGFYK